MPMNPVILATCLGRLGAVSSSVDAN